MADHYARARREREEGNPDWRSRMPFRWHVGRWWSAWWPIYSACAVVLAVSAVVAVVRAVS